VLFLCLLSALRGSLRPRADLGDRRAVSTRTYGIDPVDDTLGSQCARPSTVVGQTLSSPNVS